MTAFGPEMPSYTELAPGVRRLVAPNPSMMTGPGTNTYLLGEAAVAVIDPGPVIEKHLDEIMKKSGAPIRWVVVTHTHPDHSPAAVHLAERAGAELLGRPAPKEDKQDQTFVPGRILNDGDRLDFGGVEVDVIHTPGHASNHLCFRLVALNWILTGDHVIDGSTVVINPPDGNMKHYIESLRRLKEFSPDALVPGHGELINDPDRVIDWIIDHRLEREAKVLAGLKANPGLTAMELVPHVYKDVDPKLYGWAERSLLAHLLKLKDDGVATQHEQTWTA